MTLSIGFIATVICLGLGVSIGAVAGYFGGLVEDLLVRLIEAFQTVPPFILLIVLVAIAEPSIPAITLAIRFVSWPPVARIVRAEFHALREKDFVLAARARLQSRPHRARRNPAQCAAARHRNGDRHHRDRDPHGERAFVHGLGDPNVVSWDSMIGAGRQFLRTAWYLCALPGLAIVVAVFALNLTGDGLNEALNPRLNKRP